MSMDKRWQENFARLDAIEKQLEVLTAALNPTESLREVAEKHQQPVKKVTVKK